MTTANSSISGNMSTIDLPAYIVAALSEIVEAEGLNSLDEAIRLLLIRQ